MTHSEKNMLPPFFFRMNSWFKVLSNPSVKVYGGTKSFTIFLDEINSEFETNFFIRILLIGDRNPVIL